MGAFQHSVVACEESVVTHQVLTALPRSASHGDDLLGSTTYAVVC